MSPFARTRTRSLSPLLLLLACTIARAEDAAPVPPPVEPPATSAEVPATTVAATAEAVPSPIAPPGRSDGRLLLEFRGARLGQVLDWLSQQAGFVIVGTVDLPNPITLVGKQAMTPAEAIDALNSVLVDQGFAAIVRGKTLRIVALGAAKQQNLPVQVGSDPSKIEEGDGLLTQVIPVGFATAKDLVDNLTPLLNGSYANLTANEGANILILTDTRTNVRRIVSIIHAIDTAVGGEQQVQVFHLEHAEAEKVANVINTIYGNKSSSGTSGRNGQNQQNQFRPPWMQGPQGGGNASAATANAGKAGEVSAAADSGTNSVVVRAAPGALQSLADMVRQLDVDTAAKDGVLVYKVRNGKASDLADSLNSLFQGTQSTTTSTATTRNRSGTTTGTTGGNAGNFAGGMAGGFAGNTGGGTGTNRSNGTTSGSGGDSSLDLSGQVRVVADATSNSVLVLSAERNFPRLHKILGDLDLPLRQVLVRVLVAEVTLEKGLDVGVQLQGGNPPGAATPSNASTDFNIFDQTTGLNSYLFNSTTFNAAIKALASTTKFDVLSRPYILTADNKEATVNVSQTVPIINGTRVDDNNNVTTTFDRQDVGIILTITPQISSDGKVVLDVDQELSALTDQTIQVAADVNSPIVKKRTMTTRVAVENGQTVVIGGLVHDSLTETVSKVPWLGDLPLFGFFFRRTKSSQVQTELLIFLTPQSIQNPSELSDMSRQLRSEMQRLNAAVEPGLLQRHLDQLAALGVGMQLAPGPVTAAGSATGAASGTPTAPAAVVSPSDDSAAATDKASRP